MLRLTVHLGARDYAVEPYTGFTYATTREGQWLMAEAPRRRMTPRFAPEPAHFQRDPSLASTWAATGGTPIAGGATVTSGFLACTRPLGRF